MMKIIKFLKYFFVLSLFVLPGCSPVATGIPESTRDIPSTPTHTFIPATSTIPPVKTEESLPDYEVMAYYTGNQGAFDSFQAFNQYLSMVSVDVYSVDRDGMVIGDDPYQLVHSDLAEGMSVFACISNYNSDPNVEDFDPALAHLAIIQHKEQVISQLVQLAREEGYSGINIDFESLAFSEDIEDDRLAFTIFIQDLAASLHENGFKLVISVPGMTMDTKEDPWFYPFDLAALGKEADYLQIMTYDQHGPWSEPGPVSGADWVRESLEYVTSLVDPSKLFIGLPAYGYDWDVSESNPDSGEYVASTFSWTDVPALLGKTGAESSWDEISQSPSVKYGDDGHNHEAWFENEESIGAKIILMQEYKLAGLSVWTLGLEDETFWQAATRK